MYMVVDIKVLTLISLESIHYDMEWRLDIFTRSGNGFVCGDEVEPNGWKDNGCIFLNVGVGLENLVR